MRTGPWNGLSSIQLRISINKKGSQILEYIINNWIDFINNLTNRPISQTPQDFDWVFGDALARWRNKKPFLGLECYFNKGIASTFLLDLQRGTTGKWMLVEGAAKCSTYINTYFIYGIKGNDLTVWFWQIFKERSRLGKLWRIMWTTVKTEH